ncbi:MAG: hypothetical protein QM537_05060 [Candidatus Symbiobacter sp.]|nr:hypothetical protein [Candidatus Symbiobacter sp.]
MTSFAKNRSMDSDGDVLLSRNKPSAKNSLATAPQTRIYAAEIGSSWAKNPALAAKNNSARDASGTNAMELPKIAMTAEQWRLSQELNRNPPPITPMMDKLLRERGL